MAAFGRGLRDTLTLRALGSLAALWLASALLWIVGFVFYRVEIISALKSLAAYALGLGQSGASWLGLSGSAPAIPTWLGGTVGVTMGYAMGTLLTLFAYWICVLLTVRIAMELFLMRSIRAQALRLYPGFAAASPVTKDDWRLAWRNSLGPWLGAALVVPLCLVMPLIGGLLLAAFLAYLNVRTLVNDAFEGIADAERVRAFVSTHRWHMLQLGGLLALLAFVPLVGFLLPWVTGSAVSHLALGACLEDSTESVAPAADGS